MNSKYIKSAVKIVLVTAGAIGVLLCLIWFMDNVMNGVLAQWFSKTFLEDAYYWDPSTDRMELIPNIIWSKFREFLAAFLVVCAILSIVAVRIILYYRGKKTKKQQVDEISQMIHDYMQTDRPDLLHISGDYANIENQLLQIKAIMQRHEHALTEEARRKNDLITYLAHDLKTPLTSVIGYLSLLDEASDMPDAQRIKYVKVTLNKAERLEKLIQEFFEITRYNLQSMVLEKEQFDLYYLFIQLIDEFYPILEPLGKKVILHADENLTYYGDSQKLARVFNNILKNAASYSYENTAINIHAVIQNGYMVISFVNEGKEIPPNKLETIFEKFFRMDEARTSDSGGAGLGLAIAKEIVALHGGTLAAISNEKFTTFTVSLPTHGENHSESVISA